MIRNNISETKWWKSIRITIIYLIFGTVWILFSDKILEMILTDKESMTSFQSTKGVLFVLLTGFLFFQLSKRDLRYVNMMQRKADRSQSEQKNAILKLNYKESKYRQLVEGMLSGYVLLEIIYDKNNNSKDLRLVEANKAFEENSGLELKKVIGKTASEAALELDNEWLELLSYVNKTGENLRKVRFDPTFNIWVKFSAYKYDENYVAVFFEDISKQIQNQEAINNNRNRLEDLVRDRTMALEEKNNELKRFYDATIDRELRMEELKKEIRTLKGQLRQKSID